METEEITIKVDSQVAQIYRSAPPDEQHRMDILFSLWFRAATTTTSTMEEIMDKMNDETETISIERQLASAAEALLEDYTNDEELTCFTALDGESFHA